MAAKFCTVCIVFLCVLRLSYSLIHHGALEVKEIDAFDEVMDFIIMMSLFYTAGLFDKFL